MKKLLKKYLTEEMYSTLKDNYKSLITDYKRDIYSEFGEDFIAAVLLGFKEDGTYVDIGAFRPKELSVTYYFYKKLGWSGIVIEPNPIAQSLFEKQRPKDTFVNMGVCNQAGELTYFEFKDPTLNSFSESAYEEYQETFVGKKQIEVRRLDDILSSHLKEGKAIDLMNIDVEGLDFEVLESNDWTRFAPKVLIIEDHLFNPEAPMDSKIVQFLKERGYSLKANCLISLVFMQD